MSEPFVSEFVARAPALRDRHHEATIPEAREMVGHTLAGYAEKSRQLARIGGCIRELDQYPGPCRVGQRVTEPGKGGYREKCLHRTRIQATLYRLRLGYTHHNLAVRLFTHGCTIFP